MDEKKENLKMEPLKEKYKQYKLNNENQIFNIPKEEELLTKILKTEISTKIEIENSSLFFNFILRFKKLNSFRKWKRMLCNC
jgi:hypothetical protein